MKNQTESTTHSYESRRDFDRGEQLLFLSVLIASAVLSLTAFAWQGGIVRAPAIFFLGLLLSLSAPPFYFSLLRLVFFSELRAGMMLVGVSSKFLSLSLFFFGPPAAKGSDELWSYLMGILGLPLSVIVLALIKLVHGAQHKSESGDDKAPHSATERL